MVGKLDADALARLVLGRTGADDPAVVQGPAYGEDTAAIDLGETTLVVNSDPISFAGDGIGALGVHVACNDVAASGARPRWLTNVCLLPDADPETLDAITAEVDDAAAALDVSVVGGHAEHAPGVDHPVLSLTCMGVTDRYVPTGGARPGDAVLLTKAAGVEATAVLAADFEEELREGVDRATLDAARAFADEVSVVPEATALAPLATAMHDPTEGGVLTGLVELALASDVAVDVDRDAIPVRPETAEVCAAAGVDPLRTFGSGALLATVPADEADAALDAVRERGVSGAAIGEVRASDAAGVTLDGETIKEAPRDDLYRLWE
ncbi:AIR synthase family protein [Halomarina halobia]|uniref:AIR synthase family protein n=1 Tax=Halomarina halobia TaxID=3033386 RepID=A0ABD6A7B3_9EURY|nr:AIR synthase family protein [Halomarina sp. PSR21]